VKSGAELNGRTLKRQHKESSLQGCGKFEFVTGEGGAAEANLDVEIVLIR
jgi:hypothetical protein